ncbi:restriction endonuclease subunit S [Paraglaciecola sp. 2405UD69-4]|uniref:restriction endonuclease subunit S n=1 Tax=Paraglaciecola sp. 2405UD69-4 TaxID=3391836 RepID=UPI0039C8D843
MGTPSEYNVVKLSDIASFKTGRLNSNAAVEGGEFPFFTCSRETFRTNTWSFDCECVLLAGNNANAEYPVKYFNGKFDAYQRTYVIKALDSEYLNIRYLYYCIELKLNLLKSFSTGSATRFLTKTTLDNLEFNLPNKDAQDQIVENLSNYDNLIENNNRRIAILEDMAQSLYREWFVNFRYPNHEDNLHADGNPKLIDSPLGQIPEGWEVKSAAEAITINPKTKLEKEGEKPFVGMSGLSQGSMVIGDIIEKTGNSGAKFINGDTLFARITPCLQNGKTGYVQFLTSKQPVGFGSTEFIVLRESEYLSSEYIYLLSRSNNFREHAIQSMTGATGRQRVHNDCFASYYLAVPPKELMNEFTQMVKPMFKSIFNLSRRNQNLKQQRDMLLPKLISGQIEL